MTNVVTNGKYTKEQLVKTYKLYFISKEARKTIVEKTGMTLGSIMPLMYRLKEFVDKQEDLDILTPPYREAVIEIRDYLASRQQHKKIEQPEMSEPIEEENNLQKLEKAFTNFQEAIADVIISEVDKRAAEKVSEKESELAKQKEYYERELIKLQTIIAQAKDSSIIGMIQRKWKQ